MFAIIMSIILCLLSVGYLAISVKDQRQTLDKTLSFQATYAAESAINAVQTAYQNDPTILSNANCKPAENPSAPPHIVNLIGTIPTVMTNVSISCLTWTPNPPQLTNTSVNSEPWVVPITPVNPADPVASIKITWSLSSGSGSAMTSYQQQLTFTTSGTPPTSGIPTIRLAAASSSDILTTGVVFINPAPASSGGGSATIGSGTSSGSIENATCSTTTLKCNMTLSLANLSGPWIDGRLSITSLNGSSNVTVVALDTTGTVVPLMNAQVEVDATALSQDVIKRLVAYVSLNKTTWQPDFAASADYLCKNYALDANGNTNLYTGMVSTNYRCP